MRLLFRQRMFSWFDSYDIYDENGNNCIRSERTTFLGSSFEYL